jgi:hypothetical protein
LSKTIHEREKHNLAQLLIIFNFEKKSQYIISIELKEAFLGHADADDQLQHTYPDVDGAGAPLVEKLAGLDGGAMTHVALSPQLEASTGIHGVEGFLADTRIASRTPARTVKICKTRVQTKIDNISCV